MSRLVRIDEMDRSFDIEFWQSVDDFREAWERRVESTYRGEPIRFIGLDDLIHSKKVAARPQDLLDLTLLRAARARRRT